MQQTTPRRQISPVSEYKDSFRLFVGTCHSPATKFLFLPSFCLLQEEIADVRDVVLAIGLAYKLNLSDVSSIYTRETDLLAKLQRELLYKVQERLTRPCMDSASFVLAVLVVILQVLFNGVPFYKQMTDRLQLMVGQNLVGPLSLLDQITKHIVEPREPRQFGSELDRSVLLLFRVLEALGNSARNQDTVLAEPRWCRSINLPEQLQWEFSTEKASCLFGHICSLLAATVRLGSQ